MDNTTQTQSKQPESKLRYGLGIVLFALLLAPFLWNLQQQRQSAINQPAPATAAAEDLQANTAERVMVDQTQTNPADLKEAQEIATKLLKTPASEVRVKLEWDQNSTAFYKYQCTYSVKLDGVTKEVSAMTESYTTACLAAASVIGDLCLAGRCYAHTM